MLAKNEVLQQGRYRIINQYRQDGRGAVYEAFDNVFETNVLLKENLGNSKKVITVSQMETCNLAFADAAKVLTEIKHESLLHVRDYFSEVDRQYLVLEYTDGSDLGELLKKSESSFALSDVVNWADQLLNALSYLHSHTPPIIHGDINPRNLRLTSDNKIKLLTFDLAKNAQAKVNPTVSNQNFVVSTLHYLPLEQIWGGLDSATQRVITNSYDERAVRVLEQPADALSDIYALGATLYHLLTAQAPIDALERSIDVLEGKPDPLPIPHQLNPNIPPEVSEVLLKSMEIRREKRFFSAVIMRQVLRTAFVRMKEREAQVGIKEDILELSSAESQKSEAEQQLVEQKRLKAEAEQNRQSELVRQQLLEAKAQKIKAEHLAADLEKQRVEKEAKELENKESLATTIKYAEIVAKVSSSPSILPKPIREKVASGNSTVEFGDLFATPPKTKKMWWLMPVVAVTLLLVGGGIFGLWILPKSETTSLNQTVSNSPVSVSDKPIPEPTIETAPVLEVEATPELNTTPTPVSSSVVAEKQIVQPIVKPKPAPPRVEKPIPPTTKTPPKQPKAITVEDLINN